MKLTEDFGEHVAEERVDDGWIGDLGCSFLSWQEPQRTDHVVEFAVALSASVTQTHAEGVLATSLGLSVSCCCFISTWSSLVLLCLFFGPFQLQPQSFEILEIALSDLLESHITPSRLTFHVESKGHNSTKEDVLRAKF